MAERLIQVEAEEQGKRLDIYLSGVLADLFSRSQIKKMIDSGGVKVQGSTVSPHYKVKAGEEVRVEIQEETDDGSRAENIPLHILFEDEDLILVNKPAGMVVHPAHGNPHHTLVNALLFHTLSLSERGGPARPGIVHRLDKDTSGIMVIAKNDRAHAFLAKQFKNQSIERFYRVIVRGVVQHDQGLCEEAVGRAFLNRKKIIVRPSGGKEALTHFKVLRRFNKATLLEVCPQTGRTHQIRVHMKHIGHPVMGDLFYGVPSPWISRQAVHAFGLGFMHPRTREKIYQESPVPADMLDLLHHLESEK